ncbi:MAG: NfeD family protein [Paracoccaceae bacterium]|jgi:membrane protein implicated in regulation of membrane protease activity
MEAGLFTWIETLPPWWWVALGVGLGALEMMIYSFVLIWPAMAAIVMAIILWIAPELQGELQVTLFAVLSIALMFAGRGYLRKFGDGEPETNLNARSEQMVGKKATVVDFALGDGHIELNGLRWAAEWPDGQSAEVGQVVKIIAADGMSVLVENI